MVFVLLVGGVDQLLNNLVVLPALVDNGAEVLPYALRWNMRGLMTGG